METPMICSPRPPYLFWSSTKRGISSRQGTHQVAQKSSSTIRPQYDERVSRWPSSRVRVKSGARGCGFGPGACVPERMCFPKNTARTSTSSVTPNTVSFPVKDRNHSPLAVGYPLSTQLAPKLSEIYSTFTFVNPIECKMSSAGFTLGQWLQGQQPQYRTMNWFRGKGSTRFRSCCCPASVDAGPMYSESGMCAWV